MPIRVKSKPAPVAEPLSPQSGSFYHTELPDILHGDDFRTVVKKLSLYIADVVYTPSTFEQLRTTAAGDPLRTLTDHLSRNVTNPAIVNALLALRWHYGTGNDESHVSEARASACEIVAWRFLTRLSEREAVEFCLYEIPGDCPSGSSSPHVSQNANPEDGTPSNERTALLGSRHNNGNSHLDERPGHAVAGSMRRSALLQSVSKLTMSMHGDDDEEDSDEEDDPTAPFIHLNALEIAAIADAKRFLSQHIVQKIITGIWNGDIIFWDNLSVHTVKKPRFYNPRTADPFSRLRVPKYLKAYEVLFFISFLGLYYGVLIEHNNLEHDVHEHKEVLGKLFQVTVTETLWYIWFAAFCYDEISEYLDAGSIFYAADVWNMFDMIMIAIGLVFVVMRGVGIHYGSESLISTAFDVLSLEALFMVPRIFSILSLSPYWGTLIPCLKAMGKDFLKFMVLVVIIYLGFLTTFTLIGREHFGFQKMAGTATKIFFGSSYLGFDIMDQIDPIFGPPLMLIFITLSSILLMGSLTGMLSNSFSRVIQHAREEYLFVYSIYVLEASTSNRLTHFYPPFNLVALVIFRPLRLLMRSDDIRQARIVLLKVTHAPIVGAIHLYEYITVKLGNGEGFENFRGPRAKTLRGKAFRQPDSRPQSGHRPQLPSARPTTSGAPINTPAPQRHEDDEDAGDAPTDVEVRISELTAKIDRLTSLVLSLQTGAGLDTVRT
ncbi:ion transporter [Microdochium bolleyi]|uniref:Ion transporter n=1 Tax=Microdochium bolleyi TaxID=196109 RepID=A0A136JDS7_9PEZI|nr:ion transporter [Microdochium bolleyi]